MKKLINILLIIILASISYSQELNHSTRTHKDTQADEQIFTEIESAINNADINKVSKYFGQKTYFSLTNGINGYYSSNQAFYVLKDFFEVYKVTSFKLDHIKNDKNNSYATGKYYYDNNGKRSSAQVYLSVKKVGSNWIITQLTIN
jgi:hypothetical protein